jgi:hypothetical protein
VPDHPEKAKYTSFRGFLVNELAAGRITVVTSQQNREMHLRLRFNVVNLLFQNSADGLESHSFALDELMPAPEARPTEPDDSMFDPFEAC